MQMMQHLRWVIAAGIVLGVAVGCFEQTPPKTAADDSRKPVGGSSGGISACSIGGTAALEQCEVLHLGCDCKLENTGGSCKDGGWEMIAVVDVCWPLLAGPVVSLPDAGAARQEERCNNDFKAPDGRGREQVVEKAFELAGERVATAILRMKDKPNDPTVGPLLREYFGVGLSRCGSDRPRLTPDGYRDVVLASLEKIGDGFGMENRKKKKPKRQFVLTAYCVRDVKPDPAIGDPLAQYRKERSNEFDIYDAFFAASLEEQVATAVHEMAHVWIPKANHPRDAVPPRRNLDTYPQCFSGAIVNPYSIEEFVMKYSR